MTDMVMPGMDGPRLASCLQAVRPELPVLFMSGYPGHTITRHGIAQDGLTILPKPFTANQLGTAIRELLDHRAPARRIPAEI